MIKTAIPAFPAGALNFSPVQFNPRKFELKKHLRVNLIFRIKMGLPSVNNVSGKFKNLSRNKFS